jgi:hypothetical protein
MFNEPMLDQLTFNQPMPDLLISDPLTFGVTQNVSAASSCAMPSRRAAVVIIGIALLTIPGSLFAQHGGGGGGGHGMMSTGMGNSAGRPDGVEEKDGLKDFHRAMAVQATPDQRAAFAKISQYTEAAGDQLHAFRESLRTASSAPSDRTTALDQAIARARAGNQNFLTSFSPTQKSGLKDITGKLEKSDSELDKQIKTLDQILQTPKPDSEQVAASASALDKGLAGFQNEQLALGSEMSILFPAAGEGVTFTLPLVTNSIDIAGQSIAIPASGGLSRASSENGVNVFNLKVVADLSDLQQNVSEILRAQLNRSPRCGERIEVLQATFTPLAPAGLVVVNFHFERWVCSRGQQGPVEVAGGEATIDVKLTPSVAPTGLALASEISRVQADGLLRDLLSSGDLGVTLREQIAASLLSALQKSANLKATLPPAAQNSATLQKAEFEDAGSDQLTMILDGQLQFSDEQTTQFAAQLKQRLAAQGTSPQ